MKIILVIALSLFGLVASSQREMVEDECGGIDVSYFNFFINVDIPDTNPCKLESVGETIQDVVDEVRAQIPDHPDEFLEADVCPIPEAADRRVLRGLRMLARRNRYSYAGGSTCRKCRRNQRVGANGGTGRNLGSPRHACDMVDEAESEVISAFNSCEDAEIVLQELKDYAKSQKYLPKKEADKFVKKGEDLVEDCHERKERARAASMMVEKTCEETEEAEKDEPFDFQVGLDVAGNIFNKAVHEEAKKAEEALHKVKEGKMKLKEKVLQAKMQGWSRHLSEAVVETPRRNLGNPEKACDTMEDISREAQAAEKSCEAATRMQTDLFDYTKTQEHLDDTEASKYLEKVQEEVKECCMCNQLAKAAYKMAKVACDVAMQAEKDNEPNDYQVGLDVAADLLYKPAEEEAKHAEEGYYKAKEETMNLKEKATDARFENRKDTTEAEEEGLKAKLEQDLERLKKDMDDLEDDKKAAKKDKDEEKEEQIKEEIEALKDLGEEMKEALKAVEEQNDAEHKFDYKFETGVLDVEAANSLEDWSKEFAKLVDLVLPGKLEEAHRGCFKQEEPSVQVDVIPVESEGDKITEDDCRTELD